MNILLTRLYDSGEATLGMLYYKRDKLKYCYILEDTYNKIKIPGSTRIPAGQYQIKLRTTGSTYQKYCNHKNPIIRELTQKYGILHLQDVPNFKYVLIHIGNSNEDTEGCLLPADVANNFSTEPGRITHSTYAYIDLGKAVYPCFDIEEPLFINILDNDKNVENQFKV